MTEFAGWCSGCKRWLPVDSFRPNSAMLSGRHPQCRECVSAYMRAWRDANPEYIERKNRAMREAYAAKRGSLERVCVNPDCARVFVASRADQKACSGQCRDHLAYLRRRVRRASA